MEFDGYDWDEFNEGHLAEHGVTPSEFEEIVENGPTFVMFQDRNGELRSLELGHTNNNEVLYIVWTERGNLVRPITAYKPSKKIEEEYLADLWGSTR